MEQGNWTMVTYFIIKGISDVPELQLPIFLLVLLIYLITLGGNMTILMVVCLDRVLHTPMYFFLGNLSIVDMSSTTAALHKGLLIFITGDRVISYVSCISQVYFLGWLTSDELLILTAMSCDRYVAICNPLRYSVIMNWRLCCWLAVACWVVSFVEITPYVILVTSFSCYKSNVVNHFFCDLVPLKKLACKVNFSFEMFTIIEGVFILTILPLFLTIISYIFIINSILKIQTSRGRRKAFYTCSSHLTVVILLYTTLISQYLSPTSNDIEHKKLLSLFNMVAVPMLNHCFTA
ncbi:olfactory receptor 5V1-like [Phyllobates terribilis]|uniref:olfactory receptor 5V1-like n=1 Tax=Phyllobates terribilis TaxID=111132 RepID=UPI003CCAFA42